MDESIAPFETLKQILRYARQPYLLNDHPWTRSLIVQEALDSCPQLAQAEPGQQLIGALAGLFPALQPATPPRAGKRLDPRWGEFGLLAALYFKPFTDGSSFPSSLLDAWGRIDCAILHFVFNGSAAVLPEEQIEKYRLVGADVEYGTASTLSDWHRKGLQRFTEVVLNRERFLSRSSTKPSVILNAGQALALTGAEKPDVPGARERRYPGIRLFRYLSGLLLITALGLGSFRAWRIYERALPVYQDVSCLRQVRGTQTDVESLDPRCASLVLQLSASDPAPEELEAFERVTLALEALQTDLSAFKAEAAPVLRLGPRLGWVPVYGNDLASAPALVDLAEHLVDASLLSAQAARPLLREFRSAGSPLDPAGLTDLLVEAQPVLAEARRELDRALAARETIPVDRLSPRLQGLIVEELDPALMLADQGLSLARALPGVLGAASDGPKTYMLLAQNEDELRPTGGFITAIGNLVLHKGEAIRFGFESVDSDVQEDWDQPYPAAPWQLQEYMNSPVLVLRDANWFSDFPTTALWVEYLYAYTHSHSVDGVIAFDQQFLVILLGKLGPLDVEGVPYPITAENVLQYMRQAKLPPPGETFPVDWDRKAFIEKLADAVLQQLNNGNHDWTAIAQGLFQALAERHLLLQFDDPTVSALIAERGWDNAIRPARGDYLLVTDTNIGFNKTNAVVDVDLTYDVDLSDLRSPLATLTLVHQNNAREAIPCIQWDSGKITGEEWYPTNRCYWSYLRVYKQADVQLLSATPHAIPGDWMIGHESIPARVDVLDDEELPNVGGFGTLLVVPGGKALVTSFEFALPRTVISAPAATGEFTYRLRVQKQPGTAANPLVIRLHLPENARLASGLAGAVLQGQNLLLETSLQTDVEIEVVFTLP
jgi:hypothetical protein